MSIYYRMDEQTDNMNPNENKKKGMYPRIISKKTLSLPQLCKNAAEGTTFNSFELEAAVRLIINEITIELSEGNNVCLDDFGTFSLSAEATRTVQDEHEIRAESIRVKKVVFKTSRRLMRRFGEFKFQKKSKT